jgi:hypothetical protein
MAVKSDLSIAVVGSLYKPLQLAARSISYRIWRTISDVFGSEAIANSDNLVPSGGKFGSLGAIMSKYLPDVSARANCPSL